MGKVFKAVTSIFSPAKAPPPPALPPPPPDNTAAVKAQEAAAEEERRKRANAGSASNILTSPLGDTEEQPSARRVLLG
jgi:hypothetical protein